MKTGTVLLCSAFCSAALSASCADYRPPFTQASTTSAPADQHQATLVFLWPTDSCDPGGYYVLATEDGRFLGTVSSGTQLRSVVAPGPVAIVGWNEPQEKARGNVVKSAVSVVHGTLSEGRTYYVQMKFGVWDEEGPREVFAARGLEPGHRSCLAPDHSMTTAMVRLTPQLTAWKDVPRWKTELEGLAPDRAPGQAWLDANRDALLYHRDVAEERFAELRPRARRMATLELDDGVMSSW